MKPKVDISKVAKLKSEIEKLGNGEDDVFTDGIIDLERYNNAPLRILWVLKEAVSDYCRPEYNPELIDENIANKTFASTLKNVGYVSYAILNGIETWDEIPDIYEKPGPAESLYQIAIINVKKAMGETRSNSGDIVRAFEKNRSLVFEQIETYNPDIVIMGYPEDCCTIVHQIIDHFEPNSPPKKRFGDCASWMGRNRLYLWAYHPSRKGKRYCEEILGAVAGHTTD